MSDSIPRQLSFWPERVCTDCGVAKPEEEFYVYDKRTGHRFSRCKDCYNARKRAAYAANPERYNAQSLAWQKAHPDKVRATRRKGYAKNREQELERARIRNATPEAKEKRRAYKAANAEKIKAQNAEYRQRKKAERQAYQARYYRENAEECGKRIRRSIAANPEKYQAIHRAWKQSHNAAVNSHTHKRRALLRGMGGVVTAFEWERIKAQHQWRCVDCGRQEKTEGITLCRDHIIPLRPGFNIAANIAPRCKQCNSKKHRRLLRRREG